MKKSISSRREFISRSSVAAAGLTLINGFPAYSYKRIPGAGEKKRVGFIGIGNRGSQLLKLFMENSDCEIAALCDVYEPYLLRDKSKVSARWMKDLGVQIPGMGEEFKNKVDRYDDFRKLLDDRTIDAVCIATPDHWHAAQTIMALQSGKHVYVEKPLTNTLVEGRAMVNAQKEYKRIVAVGLNRRGAPVYQKLARDIPAGRIGKITTAAGIHVGNMAPNGIGKLKSEDPPQGFNWDMWLGPREYRPYQYNIAPYMFRWWNHYSSQMGNWGVHYMDAIRWLMNEKAPEWITAHGGKYAVNDDRTIPDTMQVTFEFASGSVATFSIFEASTDRTFPYGEIELRGTKATLYASAGGYRVIPTKPGQFQTWDKLTEAEEFTTKDLQMPDGSSREGTATLVRNFLDCMSSGNTPLCPLEEGHRSTSFAHLANIALATRSRLHWDAETEKFLNNDEANKLLQYEYRKPWRL